MKNKKPIEEMSFEEALEELSSIVNNIDNGIETLDGAIASFERGISLKSHCQKQLKNAQQKVEKIIQNSDGKISTEAVKLD